MTSRIPRWERGDSAVVGGEVALVDESLDPRTGREDQSRQILQDPVPVTEGMVDEAVANVVRARGLRPDAAAALKATLGRDTAGGSMNAYYTAKAAATRKRMVGVGRKDFVIPYVLDDASVQDLTDYAPEFRFKFHSVVSHDHSVAAATRMVDNRLIFSRLPTGVAFSDIGGNPMTYVKDGSQTWHVCGPEADMKDPMRHKMRRMEAKRLLASSASEAQSSLATRYLGRDTSLCCGTLAQSCTVQTPVGISVHVYDIPMRDWPMIMENKAMSVVEGCLLFSSRFYEETEGVLGVSKARFEIDVKADRFSMGFSQSPSWWYEHKFSDYLLYGSDQLITRGAFSYSYRVVERRGDTLFFRILRLPTSSTGSPVSVAYKTPGIPMVSVHGFKMSKSRWLFAGSLERQHYFFPRNLWGEMVSQAAEDFERGVMDFTKMYNHYRTISVRHTINAVLVMGGEQVTADELVPLVVHSCLAAAAQSLLGQRTTRGLTEAALRLRSEGHRSTFSKVVQALGAMAKSAALLPFYPLKLLGDAVKNMHHSSIDQWVLEWEPVATVVTVDVGTLKAAGAFRIQAAGADSVFKRNAVDMAVFDHYAAVLENPELATVAKRMCPQLELGPVKVAVADGPSESGPPSYATREASVVRPGVAADVTAVRLAAIREHIEEAKMQNRALSFTCAQAYAALSVRGEPNRAALAKKAELYRNPDFWRVENGVLVESVLGSSAEQFVHSAVYHPRPDEDTGDVVRAVFRADWTGIGRDGQSVENKNFVIADRNFSGWVLTVDDLVVYNGPEIISALEKSLALPHDYSVTLNWGPPGCGKTYAIVHEVADDGSDAVMCPVRESIEDTREQIKQLYPNFPNPKVYIRTVDSYLVNLATDKKTSALRVDRLLADECFMTHAGKWYAAAALLGVKRLEAYGDDFQIPHIPRVQAPKQFVKLKCDDVRYVWETRRCPATAVAAWGSVYGWKVRTHSKELGTLVEVRDTKGREIPDNCVMMCMYQADKRELKRMYAADLKRIRILTANEAEGKTYDHVWLHRFDQRVRKDRLSLFDQQPHVLVAMSRHKKTFVYRCPAPLGDMVSAWVERGNDARRVAAASDLETAGSAVEKL